MNPTDYIFSAALILVVVRQFRGRRLAGMNALIPLAIVAYVATQYLHTFPTAGNSVELISLAVTVGLTLGVLSAMFSRVYRRDGVPFVRATWIAAAFWILGVGARLGFSLYADHGGGPSIAHFSAAHALPMQAWVTALILMALAEVLSRTGVLLVRARRLEDGADSAIIRVS